MAYPYRVLICPSLIIHVSREISMTLWSGRFSTKFDEKAWTLNTSLPFDQRLAIQDVRASIAWAGALRNVTVLTPAEHQQIATGLHAIEKEFTENKFVFVESDE